MILNRRRFVTTAAAWPLIGSFPSFARTELIMGMGKIQTISDGAMHLPGEFIFSHMPQDELLPILAKYNTLSTQLVSELNVTLYQDDVNTVLFDVGSGPDFMSTAGKLLAAIEDNTLDPESVTHVVFTHAHPDHIWGLLDDFGDLMFPNATYMMGRGEWDYWWNPNTVDTIDGSRTTFAVGAKRRMEVIEDKVEFIDDGQEILPGIMAQLSAGHTPGHMAYVIHNGGQSAMVAGDAIGNHHIAFERPAWHSGSDQNLEMAAVTRVKLLDQLAHEKITLIGYHLPNGGIGRVEKRDDGFVFVSEG